MSGPRVVDGHSREQMKKVLTDIQNGTFAKNWIAENEAGKPNYKRMMDADMQHPIEAVGERLRAQMPWLED